MMGLPQDQKLGDPRGECAAHPNLAWVAPAEGMRPKRRAPASRAVPSADSQEAHGQPNVAATNSHAAAPGAAGPVRWVSRTGPGQAPVLEAANEFNDGPHLSWGVRRGARERSIPTLKPKLQGSRLLPEDLPEASDQARPVRRLKERGGAHDVVPYQAVAGEESFPSVQARGQAPPAREVPRPRRAPQSQRIGQHCGRGQTKGFRADPLT